MIEVEPGRLYVRVVEGRTIRTCPDAAPPGTDPRQVCGAFVALTHGWALEVEGRDYREMALERVERIVGLLGRS